MKVRFWGVRGSIPSPVSSTAIEEKIICAVSNVPDGCDVHDSNQVRRYVRSLDPLARGTVGGNTSCVEVVSNETRIIIDAGSGIRELGLELMRGPCGRGQGELHLLFSHPHYDHVQGFPFFIPAFVPGNQIFIYGVHDMRAALTDQQHQTFFPVPFSVMRATFHFVPIEAGPPFQVGAFTVRAMLNNHPGRAYSYRIEDQHSALIYASDSEYKDTEVFAPRIAFFQHADALIFDAQYTLRDAWQKVDWGHSSAMIGTELARAAGVRQLLLFHHDPTYSDTELRDIRDKAIAFQSQNPMLPVCEVQIAYEGLTLDLTPLGTVDLRLAADGATTVLTPASGLDALSLQQIEQQLAILAEKGAHLGAVIDLAQVDTLSTPALKALLGLARTRPQQRLALAGVSASSREVIRLSGYTEVFAIYPTVEAALEAMRLREALNLPGAILKGRYRIERWIAELPAGNRLAATDVDCDAPVIVMILSPVVSSEALTHLRHVVQQLAALEHPAIGRLLSLEHEGDCTFLVAEPPNGQTLAELIANDALPLSRALTLVGDLARALDVLHRHGVIHANVSPETIIIGSDGLRLDWAGLGLLDTGRRLSEVPPLVIDPLFAPPEQLMGESIDIRVDLYAFGVICYRLLLGHYPYAIIESQQDQVAYPLNTIDPAISPGLSHMLLKLLDRSPTRRYASAQQVIRVLDGLDVAGESMRRERLLTSRQHMLHTLLGDLASIQAGSGKLVVISGEMGIGKTVLTRRLAAHAGEVAVLVATCREAGLAYHPFIEIMRACVSLLPPELYDTRAQPWLSALSILVPELRDVLPDLPLPTPLEPRHEQLRLISSMLQLVSLGCKRQPWLLIIDDLHWADEASLEVLRAMARGLPELPLLLVTTIRDSQAEVEPALRQVLVDLDRYPGYRHMFLDRLSLAEVGQFLAEIWEDRPPQDLIAQIHHQTGGNPLYVEEIARDLDSDGQIVREGLKVRFPLPDAVQLPQNVRDTIWRRIRRLNPDIQSTLRQASVLGSSFVLEHLQAISEFTPNDVLEHLDVALERRLVEEQLGGRTLSFSHAEIHHVLYQDLSTVRRRLLHRRAADAIERFSNALHYALELARHLSEAGEFERAIPYAFKAAEQFAASYANEQAITWYNRGLEWYQQLPVEAWERLKQLRIAAQSGRGHMLELIGQWDEAFLAYDAALQAAFTTHDRLASAQNRLRIGRLLIRRGDADEARQWLIAAQADFAEVNDQAGMAMVLVWQGQLAYTQKRYAEAIQLYKESLALYEQLQDSEGVALNLHHIGMIALVRGDLAEAQTKLMRAVDVRRSINNLRGMTESINSLALVDSLKGNTQDAIKRVRAALHIARDLGDVRLICNELNNLGYFLTKHGQIAEAEPCLHEALVLSYQLGARPMLINTLESFSTLAIRQAQYPRALHLAGAAAALRRTWVILQQSIDDAEFQQELLTIRTMLGLEAALEAESVGEAMSLEHAVAYALRTAMSEGVNVGTGEGSPST